MWIWSLIHDRLDSEIHGQVFPLLTIILIYALYTGAAVGAAQVTVKSKVGGASVGAKVGR